MYSTKLPEKWNPISACCHLNLSTTKFLVIFADVQVSPPPILSQLYIPIISSFLIFPLANEFKSFSILQYPPNWSFICNLIYHYNVSNLFNSYTLMIFVNILYSYTLILKSSQPPVPGRYNDYQFPDEKTEIHKGSNFP